MKKSRLVVLHFIYWGIYIFLLTAIITSFVGSARPGYSVGEVMANLFILAIVPAVIAFYLMYGFIFQRFLAQKRILATVLLGLGGGVAGALMMDLILLIFQGPDMLFVDGIVSFLEVTGFATMTVAVPHAVLGLGMRAFVSWFADIHTKQELEQKNHAMEMALIKSQINPHFLFNTIANIDVLIAKDPAAASDYLNKLSSIMRFMLYETQAEQIPLSKELDYIQQYIALQKIRFSNPEQVKLTISGKAENKMIAPMLFIPYIENAFKFSESKKSNPAIDIRFAIGTQDIQFQCANNYHQQADKSPDSGLGNALIERRLALLYPGKHKLQSTAQNGQYQLNLSITTA